MAIRPDYKKKYTRSEYADLVRQEEYANNPLKVIQDYLSHPMGQTPSDLMTDELIREQLDAGIPVDQVAALVPSNPEPAYSPQKEPDPDPKTTISKYWYYAGAGLLALLAAGPLYRMSAPQKGSRKRSKGYTYDEKVAVSLDAASANVASLAVSMGPVIAFPASYIAVQMMEDHDMITKGLGNAVQTLMATMAAGQVAEGAGSIISSIVKAVA